MFLYVTIMKENARVAGGGGGQCSTVLGNAGVVLEDTEVTVTMVYC